MKIIGVAGTNGSGKDTIAHILAEKHGYFSATATDMLGSELEQKGLPTDRQHKSALSAEWRRQSGMGVIVDKGVEQAEKAGYDKLVVGSLRHPGEVDRVHELGGKVVWVDADPGLRYKRIRTNNRGRVEDDKTFEQFLSEEQAEMNQQGDSATLHVSAVKDKADVFIDNNFDTIDEFMSSIENDLKEVI